MSIDGRKDKENVEYVYNRILFSHDEEGNHHLLQLEWTMRTLYEEISQTQKDNTTLPHIWGT